ncbi:MAG: DUF4080 domain-containing protein [Candidatus Cloacimonetes bacterium]|nr:DUF4080 domain-containing protein [Candidatus Cloacimonadota bacterium]
MSTSQTTPKICFIAINSAWYQSNPALYYLSNSLAGLPFNSEIYEFIVSEPLFDVLSTIVHSQSDILCFSAYIWNQLYLKLLIPEIKKLLPRAKIVIGGPSALCDNYQLDESDFIVRGPGEGAFRYLAESGFSLPGGLYEIPAPPLKSLPFLYKAENRETLEGKLVYYECSRGCPYHCIYCLSAKNNRKEQRFDPENSEDKTRLYNELDQLLALKPRTVKFVDRCFNANPDLARLIWDYVIRMDKGCEFHFEIFPELLEAEDLKLLAKAPPHRIRLEAGIQTVNPDIAKACGRVSNWKKAKKSLAFLCQKTQVKLHTDLLAGLPGESIDSVLISLDELASIFPPEIQLGSLKILPDTPMYILAKQRQYLWMDTPSWQVLKSDSLSFEQLSTLNDLARIINLYWNKGEFTSEWISLLNSGKKASQLLLSLLAYHKENHILLHSISREKRYDIFSILFRS